MQIQLLIVLSLVSCVFGQCWKRSYGRGAGKPVHQCNGGLKKSGLLCYDKCDREYNGFGPVCWEKCKEDFSDHGAVCTRNTHIYGKGCCCTIFTPNCCNNCKPEYTDDGCTCRRDVQSYSKKSYGRGFGSSLGCADDEEYDSGLCYPFCKKGYSGIGPVCYQDCRAPLPHSCGGFCGSNPIHCAQVVLRMVGAGTGLASSLYDLSKIMGDALTAFETSLDLAYSLNAQTLSGLFNACPSSEQLDRIENAAKPASVANTTQSTTTTLRPGVRPESAGEIPKDSLYSGQMLINSHLNCSVRSRN